MSGFENWRRRSHGSRKVSRKTRVHRKNPLLQRSLDCEAAVWGITFWADLIRGIVLFGSAYMELDRYWMSNALDLEGIRIEGIPLLHSEALGAVYTTTLLRSGFFTSKVLLCSAGVFRLNDMLMIENVLILY